MRETIFRGMARSSLVAVLLAWALVFSNLVPATADEAVDMPLTPVSGVAHYDADYRVPVVESQLGIGAPLSDDPASLVTLTGIEAGHDGALVRVSVFNVDEPLTVFAAGAPALAVEEGAASTMVLVPVDDGEVSLYGTASADLRVELLASFAGDPEVPGSTIALAEPVTRADTAAVLADNSLSSQAISVGVVGLGGVPSTGVRAVYLTAVVEVPGATTLLIGDQDVPVPAGRTAVTTVVSPSADGTVPVEIASGQGTLRVDVRGWVPEASQSMQLTNVVGSYIPVVGGASSTVQVAEQNPVAVSLGLPSDAAVGLVLVSVEQADQTTVVGLGEQAVGRSQGAVVDREAGAVPQLALAEVEQATVGIRRGGASVTIIPVGSFYAGDPGGYPLSKVVDPALRRCIAKAAGVPESGVLSDELIENITSLSCAFAGVRTLVGMPELPSLETLDLSGNGLVSWEGMPELPSLETLNLWGNGLVSLEGMPEFPSLETLDLSGNGLVSLEGMPEFPSLKSLVLSGNGLVSLEGMPELPSLETLDLWGNELVSLEGMPEFPSLETLYLWRNGLVSLEGMPELPSLVHLDLSENGLVSFEGMPELPSLVHLYLSENGLVSLEGMPELPSLELLVLSENGLASLEGMPELPSLESLVLSENGLVSLEGLPRLPRLTGLFLDQNLLSSVAVLEERTGLRTLSVRGLPLVDREADMHALQPLEDAGCTIYWD